MNSGPNEFDLFELQVIVQNPKATRSLDYSIYRSVKFTLQETNIASESRPSSKEVSSSNLEFPLAMFVSGKVYSRKLFSRPNKLRCSFRVVSHLRRQKYINLLYIQSYAFGDGI